MEYSPLEKPAVPSPETAHILLIPEAHCRVQNSSPFLIMSHVKPVYVLLSYTFKIRFNITLPSTPVFQMVSFLQVFKPKPCLHFSPIRTTCPAHPILLDFITL
jgi:hypothetical protein